MITFIELTPLYDDKSLSQSNPFLQDVFSRISDPDKYGKTNQNTLTDAQFETVKRIQNENIATTQFYSKVTEMINSSKDVIDTLPFKKLDYAQFERNAKAWGKYKFLSYGHPKMVELYQTMIENGGNLTSEQMKDVLYYMNKQGWYQYENPDFKEALKWFSKMQWTFDHEFADNLYDKHITDYFGILHDRFVNIKAVLEDADTLKRCEYEQKSEKNEFKMFQPETREIEVWLQKLSRKKDDPLVVWLKDNLSEDAEYEAVQNAIVNRFQLDIGGLSDIHCGVLMPLLHNEHLYKMRPDEIGKERYKVLVGTELTSEYLEELKQMVQSAQLEFAKTL